MGLVSEVDDALDGCFGGIASIAMASVHHLVIEDPVVERLEVAIPLSTTQENDVVVVYFTDSLGGTLVETFELGIQLRLQFLGKHGGDRLVHQFVTEDDRFVLVSVGDGLPNLAELLLTSFAHEEPRITISIVDIVAGLTARAVVHVEDEM